MRKAAKLSMLAAAVLGSLRLSSLDQVDNLKTLQEIVVALEEAAAQSEEMSFLFVNGPSLSCFQRTQHQECNCKRQRSPGFDRIETFMELYNIASESRPASRVKGEVASTAARTLVFICSVRVAGVDLMPHPTNRR